MTNKQFLLWLHARLINQYGESPNTNFVTRLERTAHFIEKLEEDRDFYSHFHKGQ